MKPIIINGDMVAFSDIGATLTVTDNEEGHGRYVITIQTRHISTSHKIYQFVRIAHGKTKNIKEIKNELESFFNHAITIDHIKRMIELINEHLAIPTIKNSARNTLFIRRSILSPAITNKLCSTFNKAYSKSAAYPLALTGIIALIYALTKTNIKTMTFDGIGAIQAAAIYILSALIHEIGHASALKSEARTPGEIGAGIYVCFPAFYSDVTDAWPLQRRGRIKVDIGGCYFQSLFLAAVLFVSVATGYTAGIVASWYIAATVLINLSPILRFDGYWALCDYLGVTDATKHFEETTRHSFSISTPRGRRNFIGILILIVSTFIYMCWLINTLTTSYTALLLSINNEALTTFGSINALWITLMAMMALTWLAVRIAKLLRATMNSIHGKSKRTSY